MKKLLNIIFMAVILFTADLFGQISTPIILGNNNDCEDAIYTIANYNPVYSYTWSLTPQAGTITSTGVNASRLLKFNHSINNCNYATLTVTASYMGNNASSTFNIYPCCNDNATYIFNNYTTSFSLIIPAYSTVIINGDFIMNHNVSFTNATVHVSPNSKIKLMNSGVTFSVISSLISSNIDCCTDMWDGIYTNNATQEVIIQNSTITNAQNALNINQGSSFLVENSTFKDNYRNIYIYQGSGGGTPPYQGVIRGTKFFGNLSLPYPPYQGVQTYSGVEVFRTNELTIGDESSLAYTNHFRTMVCGLNANNPK